MHIFITGAAGMIGRKLTARLVADGALNNRPIDELTLLDVTAPAKPEKPASARCTLNICSRMNGCSSKKAETRTSSTTHPMTVGGQL